MQSAKDAHRGELPAEPAVCSAGSASSMPVVSGEDHVRILQLRALFHTHRKSVGARVLSEHMHHDLRLWITSAEKRHRSLASTLVKHAYFDVLRAKYFFDVAHSQANPNEFKKCTDSRPAPVQVIKQL